MVECEYLRARNVNRIVFSFNRYMVECEFFVDTVDWGWFVGFNRYMVECEFGKTTTFLLIALVLIDTWWNVNVKW